MVVDLLTEDPAFRPRSPQPGVPGNRSALSPTPGQIRPAYRHRLGHGVPVVGVAMYRRGAQPQVRGVVIPRCGRSAGPHRRSRSPVDESGRRGSLCAPAAERVARSATRAAPLSVVNDEGQGAGTSQHSIVAAGDHLGRSGRGAGAQPLQPARAQHRCRTAGRLSTTRIPGCRRSAPRPPALRIARLSAADRRRAVCDQRIGRVAAPPVEHRVELQRAAVGNEGQLPRTPACRGAGRYDTSPAAGLYTTDRSVPELVNVVASQVFQLTPSANAVLGFPSGRYTPCCQTCGSTPVTRAPAFRCW